MELSLVGFITFKIDQLLWTSAKWRSRNHRNLSPKLDLISSAAAEQSSCGGYYNTGLVFFGDGMLGTAAEKRLCGDIINKVALQKRPPPLPTTTTWISSLLQPGRFDSLLAASSGWRELDFNLWESFDKFIKSISAVNLKKPDTKGISFSLEFSYYLSYLN